MPFPDRSFFDEVYQGRAPWDIGDAQAIVGLGVPIVSSEGERSAGVLLYFSYELPFTRP